MFSNRAEMIVKKEKAQLTIDAVVDCSWLLFPDVLDCCLSLEKWYRPELKLDDRNYQGVSFTCLLVVVRLKDIESRARGNNTKPNTYSYKNLGLFSF